MTQKVAATPRAYAHDSTPRNLETRKALPHPKEYVGADARSYVYMPMEMRIRRSSAQRGGQDSQLLTILGDSAARHLNAAFAEHIGKLLIGQGSQFAANQVFDDILDA